MFRFPRRLTAALAAFVLAAAPMAAQAGLIRDAEIEATLRSYTTPILTSAGIPPEDVRLFIVNDPVINAYVAGGLNIFVHTGLIRTAEKPGMLIGVLAHETGHIAGAHLSQLREKSNRAMLGSVLGLLVGAAAAIGGGGEAGVGIIAGSQSMAERTFNTGIRMNEQSADQAALTYLDDNDISATGMLAMFEALRRSEQGHNVQQDTFMRTHPLTSDRIAAMRNHITTSSIPADQVPVRFNEMHARMLAKLAGFMDSYEQVLIRYPLTDTSLPARYARTIADFRRSHLDAALRGIDQLITERPNDPFFYDTKGQILYENGRLPEAATAYEQANKHLPGSALILTDYARSLTGQQKPELLPKAVALLERAKEIDDSNSATWRELAVAYGRQGKMGLSYMALAEEAALGGQYRDVLQHIARARSFAGDDQGLLLKLSDLERDAQAQLRAKNNDSLF